MILYENNSYRIEVTDNAIGEDGKYGQPGYALISKDREMVESTSMLYPNLVFLADQCDGMLTQLQEEQDTDELVEGLTEDVTLPH